jgi:lambda family phage portal protein
LNALDKAIAVVSPQKALKRNVARKKLDIINTGYSHHGANTYKKSMRGNTNKSGSPKEDIDKNLALLRERSRDLYMGGSPLATGAINTSRTNVIGEGLVPKPSIDKEFLKMTDEEADNWKKIVIREFEHWANGPNCDSLRTNNFYEIQQLAYLSQLMSGDVFTLLPIKKRAGCVYDLRIQLIESDRIATPQDKMQDDNISEGVEKRNGEIVAYYILDKHPGTSGGYGAGYKRVEAYGFKSGRRNILHLMKSERPEQTRGIPVLAPVIESLMQLGRYSEAELMAAVVSGMFTVFIKSENPSQGVGEGINPMDQLDDDDYNYELGNGAIVNLGKNESIESANPGRPNSGFDPFVTSILRQVGACLEIPYELLIKHFSASYSASRAAMLEAWKMFKMRRKWFVDDFCQPIYEEWLTEAVAKGRINAPGFFTDPIIKDAYCKARWHGPSQGQIDPLKEVKAAEMRMRLNLTTGEKEAAEMNGTDYFVNISQRAKEINLINSLTPQVENDN